jgi:hypothetical protein
MPIDKILPKKKKEHEMEDYYASFRNYENCLSFSFRKASVPIPKQNFFFYGRKKKSCSEEFYSELCGREGFINVESIPNVE